MKRIDSAPRRRSGCPINVALEMIGDSWSLLIVRDLMFKSLKTFGDFQACEERIATNILADRLDRLCANGIIVKQKDSADGRRYQYRLTAKGADLAPVMVDLVLWAARHEKTEAPAGIVREMSSNRKRYLSQLRERVASS